MTQTEAVVRVNEILNDLNRLGLLPAGSPFGLTSGELVAEPHPELNTHWRPLWKPHDETMLRLDLENFSSQVAADQIARFRHASYIEVRKKLEAVFGALASERHLPIESPLMADSFLIAGVGLSIEEDLRGYAQPTFRLLLETHPIPERVEAGDPSPESQFINVTETSVAEIVQIINDM